MAISNHSLTQIKQALTEMLPKLKPLSVPTGMISAFHTVPEGWLQCDGAVVSRTKYAALFAVIGTKYGSGDGSTTFNLPNFHHKFVEGTTTHSEVGQSVSAGLPNISGTLYLDDLDSLRKPTLSGAFYDTGKRTTDPAGNYEGGCVAGLSATRSSSVYGKSQTVQPASLRLIPCIKV